MRSHEICRLGLQGELDSADPERRLSAVVVGDSAFGNTHHYWVQISDTVSGTGLEYEVEACCRWAARTAALDRHARATTETRRRP